MSKKILILLVILVTTIIVTVFVGKNIIFKPTMQRGEIATTEEFMRKYNLTAENRPVFKIDPKNVPEHLRDLIAMAEKWGICDDIIRCDFETKATQQEKEDFKSSLQLWQNIIW